MYPEDQVLVGVVKRKRDLQHILRDSWYRIPAEQMPSGISAEYLGFFLSGKVFREQSGGIYYYAPVSGIELVRRRDILPDETAHPRADHVYYRIALAEVKYKHPPVLNPQRRVVSFIYTTWDRFVNAEQISDLYSDADYYVDRVYHALNHQESGVDHF